MFILLSGKYSHTGAAKKFPRAATRSENQRYPADARSGTPESGEARPLVKASTRKRMGVSAAAKNSKA